jgi:amino acid transporter
MESVQAAAEAPTGKKGRLLHILGVGFGIAVTIGGTIGVGILRTPGTVASQLGSLWLIIVVWMLGGVYALLGTISVTELSTMLPRAGGWYVLHVLPLPQLATSQLAAADASRAIFGAFSSQVVTVISLVSILSVINAILLQTTRIMFALARDGLFSSRAAMVNAGGNTKRGACFDELDRHSFGCDGYF